MSENAISTLVAIRGLLVALVALVAIAGILYVASAYQDSHERNRAESACWSAAQTLDELEACVTD